MSLNTVEIAPSLSKLRAYIEGEGFKGYDPYDTLNAKINFSRLGKWGPILAIQLQKRNPVNLRPLLGIEKGYNPKGMGLLLHAYSLLYEQDPKAETKVTASFLFDWLCENYSKGYRGHCWGYNFDWASSSKFLGAYSPSIVVTSFVGKGIFKYYEVTGDPRARAIFLSACNFILKDLPRTETKAGICFSYTTLKPDCCFNASMLGAEMLARAYRLTNDEKMLNLATQAVDFVLSYQLRDGRWHYEIDLKSGKEDKQLDFHQGFVLDALRNYMMFTDATAPKYLSALKSGAEFYYRHQIEEGKIAKYRWPKVYPADIHNQAQAVITFAELASLDRKYLKYSEDILLWTIQNMQEPQSGYFYYRKGKHFTNKISYMRWAQAWMLLALSIYLKNSKKT